MNTRHGNVHDGPQKAIIVSAFAASGKTWLAENSKGLGYPLQDLDSSAYSKLPGETNARNPHFKEDYLAAISKFLHENTIVLISTHTDIRQGMVDLGWRYTLVYPEETLKDEWLDRLRARGSDDLIPIIGGNWSAFVEGCRKQVGCEHVVLSKGQYVSDVVKLLVHPAVG